MIRSTPEQIEQLIELSNANAKPTQAVKPTPLPVRKVKKNKYRAVPVTINGIWFPSKRQGERYKILSTWEKAGIITDLQTEVSYRLEVNGVLICKYYADSVYVMDGELVVEDVKGIKTPVYKLKKKLMKAIHGIEIKEV